MRLLGARGPCMARQRCMGVKRRRGHLNARVTSGVSYLRRAVIRESRAPDHNPCWRAPQSISVLKPRSVCHYFIIYSRKIQFVVHCPSPSGVRADQSLVTFWSPDAAVSPLVATAGLTVPIVDAEKGGMLQRKRLKIGYTFNKAAAGLLPKSGRCMQACVTCGATKTPLWRCNVDGQKSLCNR